MTISIGYYGKIPSKGDFISNGLPREFRDPWDAWLQEALEASRAVLGEAWLPCYLQSPIWRFVLAPGICGEQAAAGILMPSVDRAGRHFPFAIIALLSAALQDRLVRFALAADPWFHDLEERALETLDGSFDMKALDGALPGIQASLDLPASDGSVRANPPSGGRSFLLNFAAAETGPLLSGDVAAFLCDELMAAQLKEPHSLWWTFGSDRVAPTLRIESGLPLPASFATFIGGIDSAVSDVENGKSAVAPRM